MKQICQMFCKESGAEGPGLGLRDWEGLKAQGVGRKAKTIKNLSFPYALRLKP